MNTSYRLCSVILMAACCFGQSSIVSRLDGLVLDPTGHAVPSALVKAFDVARGISLTTSTGEDGFYRFARLTPGVFEITVSKAGFQAATQSEVGLAVNQARRLDFNLTLEKATRQSP